MNYEYEIKVVSAELPAKVLMEIKRVTGLSFGELKCRMGNNEAILGCRCSDDDGLKRILDLYDLLSAQGIKTLLYEDGKVESADLFRNLLNSWNETSHEVGLDEF